MSFGKQYIEKQAMLKALEMFPKLKTREKVPPQSVIDEMRQKHKEQVDKERKDKQKNFHKEGGAAAKKAKAIAKKKK